MRLRDFGPGGQREEYGPLLVIGSVVVVGWSVLMMTALGTRPVFAQNGPTGNGPSWTCSLDNIAATLTKCYENKDPSVALYITDIVAQSTTSTAGQFLLEYGTGTNCGTGTTALFPSAAAVVRLTAPPNTIPPTVVSFRTPLKVPTSTVGNDLCALGVATNTLTIQVFGYQASR